MHTWSPTVTTSCSHTNRNVTKPGDTRLSILKCQPELAHFQWCRTFSSFSRCSRSSNATLAPAPQALHRARWLRVKLALLEISRTRDAIVSNYNRDLVFTWEDQDRQRMIITIDGLDRGMGGPRQPARRSACVLTEVGLTTPCPLSSLPSLPFLPSRRAALPEAADGPHGAFDGPPGRT